MSIGTVRNRITAMRGSGALHLNVWLDPYRVGLGVTATFLIQVRPGRMEHVTQTLTNLNETGYLAAIAGDHDVIVDVFCKDVPHLGRVLRDGIQAIDGVESVKTYLVTDIKYESSLNITGVLDDNHERADPPRSEIMGEPDGDIVGSDAEKGQE